MAGLLNPPDDAAIAKKLLERTREWIKSDDDKLLGRVLERDDYLQTIGGRTRLSKLLTDLEKIYQTETRV